MPNRLIEESSPYLRQHAHNPVDWYPWSDEAFERAREEDKLVLLSIGYSACHWCHVMERESFAHGDVAEALDRGFVSVKLDREERPDVDHFYMQACQQLTGSGGWPLTALLTPDRKPFFAGTYYPKESLLSILAQAERLWRTSRDKLLRAVRRGYQPYLTVRLEPGSGGTAEARICTGKACRPLVKTAQELAMFLEDM